MLALLTQLVLPAQAQYAEPVFASANAAPPASAERPLVTLAEYDFEYFRGTAEEKASASNLELAAALLNGAMIEPRAVLSFNRRIGPRTAQGGFKTSRDAINERVTDSFGGGVTQVASTLHIAALLAGLDIVERHPHRHAPSNVELGLDAAVMYGRFDLRVRNPYDFSLFVQTQLSVGKLVVRIRGVEDPYASSIQVRTQSQTLYTTRYVVDSKMSKGRTRRIQAGRPGFVLTVERTISDRGGNTIARESSRVQYAPREEIISIGSRKIAKSRTGVLRRV